MSKDVLKFEDVSEKAKQALEALVQEAGGIEEARKALESLESLKKAA